MIKKKKDYEQLTLKFPSVVPPTPDHEQQLEEDNSDSLTGGDSAIVRLNDHVSGVLTDNDENTLQLQGFFHYYFFFLQLQKKKKRGAGKKKN